MPKKASTKTPATKTTARRTTRKKAAAKKKSTRGTSRKGVKRPTEAERLERLQFAIRLWLGGKPREVMKHEFARHYKTSPSTADDYLVRARSEIAKMRDKTNKELVDECYARNVDRLGRCETVEQEIRVERTIMDLLGLRAPVRVAHTDSEGNDIASEETRGKLESIVASLAAETGELGAA